MCIINALHTLYNAGLPNIKKIIVNTDCIYFHRYLHNRQSGILNKAFSKIQTQFTRSYKMGKGWIEFRHVKAHSGVGEARKWVNDWCDKNAKAALKLNTS